MNLKASGVIEYFFIHVWWYFVSTNPYIIKEHIKSPNPPVKNIFKVLLVSVIQNQFLQKKYVKIGGVGAGGFLECFGKNIQICSFLSTKCPSLQPNVHPRSQMSSPEKNSL